MVVGKTGVRFPQEYYLVPSFWVVDGLLKGFQGVFFGEFCVFVDVRGVGSEN